MALIKQKTFSVNNNVVTFYPRYIFKIVGIIFFVFAMVTPFFFYNLINFTTLIVFFITGLVFMLPFYWIGSKKIIINGDEKKIYRQNILGKKKLCDFEEVQSLSYVDYIMYGSAQNSFYRLTLRNDPYGKGIQLHQPMPKTSKLFKEIEYYAVPVIQHLLGESKSTENTLGVSTKHYGEQLSMFTDKNGIYISKRFGVFSLIIGLLFFLSGCYWIYLILSTNEGRLWYGFILIALGIYNTLIWGRQVKINKQSKMVQLSTFWGLKNVSIPIQNISRFTTLRHTAYGMHNGTDVIMELETGKDIVLFERVKNTKKIQAIIEDMKAILWG